MGQLQPIDSETTKIYTWEMLLSGEIQKEYFVNLCKKVRDDRKLFTVFPNKQDMFKAFELTPFEKIKVVIVGQDPYHGEGQANGLAFSVNRGIPIPPSLRNIFKEMQSDLNLEIPDHGDLTEWANRGVLLLNTIMTVVEGKPGSHANIGWEQFTEKVIREISDKKPCVCFILWGKFAQSRKQFIDTDKHFVIESPHPSPFSADKGFFGSKPFSKTNDIVSIDWRLK